jgi:hypothetical protein
MVKTNKAVAQVDTGLEEIQNEAQQFQSVETDSTQEDSGEEVFHKVGGLEPAAFYYRYNAPKNTNSKYPFKVISKDLVIEGTFERQFADDEGKFTYYIRTNEGLAGIGGCGSLNYQMSKVEDGSKVQITYGGKSPSKSKNKAFAGKEMHNFTVLATRLKKA